jgi:hypothetical protein
MDGVCRQRHGRNPRFRPIEPRRAQWATIPTTGIA